MEINIELSVEEGKRTLIHNLTEGDVSGTVLLRAVGIEGTIGLAFDFADIVVLALDVDIVSLLRSQIFLDVGTPIRTTFGGDSVILIDICLSTHRAGLFVESHGVLRLRR